MTQQEHKKQRVLVVVANHGDKNKRFLDHVIGEYHSMARYSIDIIVLSNIPKDLGPNVNVNVGLPTSDPWSLPFSHKYVFLKKVDYYDLFIYSEDDILITERNIDAFVEATRILPADCIAGFIRYEVSPAGKKSYPDMHSHFHWDSSSVTKFKNLLFAYHTNEHAACFILTRQQLRKAIDSGGFMLPPRRERYDMLVTAATEPYTHCGMKKLICISRLDDFSVHHLPNAYLGELGIDEEFGLLEVKRMGMIADSGKSSLAAPLFAPYPLRDSDGWNKKYYEGPRADVLRLVPRESRRVLSIGCGCGSTEEVMVEKGVDVVGIPLDPVISASAEAKGVKMLPSNFDAAATELRGELFDCILILDILQQIPDPVAIMTKYREFLRRGGLMLISVPNWNHLGTLRRRLTVQGRCSLVCRNSRGKAGVHRTTKSLVSEWVRASGLRHAKDQTDLAGTEGKMNAWTLGLANQLLSRKIIIVAQH